MLNLKSIAANDVPDLEDFIRLAVEADWACYTTEADRAEYDRMKRVITAFPQGFRVYLQTDAAGRDVPVGYTGWYPLPRAVFDRLHDAPQTLTHRGDAAPLTSLSPDGDYLYLFNYSIIPALQKTESSRAMLQTFARAVCATPHRGMAAVTVSPDGARVAERFGLRLRGVMTHDGEPENVYAFRLY